MIIKGNRSAYTRLHTRIGFYGFFRSFVPSFFEEKNMGEKTIEMQLVKAAKKMGGRAVKFTSPGFDGMPDRLVILPEGKIAFVEVKAPGETPRALQKARHEMLRKLGFRVYVLDAAERIQEILNDIQTT